MSYRGAKHNAERQNLRKRSAITLPDMVGGFHGIVEKGGRRAAKAKDKPAARYTPPVWTPSPHVWTPPVRQPDPKALELAEMLKDSQRNFMDGISYMVNPLDTLKLISASSVFGEPQYYRAGDDTLDGEYD